MSNLQLMQMHARYFVIICVMIRTISPERFLRRGATITAESGFPVKSEFKCYLLSELLLCLLCSGVEHKVHSVL